MTHDVLLQLATAILFLPLLSFLLIIAFWKKLPRQGDIVGLSLIGLALVSAITILISKLTWFHAETISYTFTWVDFGKVTGIGPLKLELGIMVDNLVAIMLVVVTLISFLVHLFSTVYMRGDVRYARYFAYLGIFTFSMLGIVITNNFFMMYVFWELVGLSSYLLIGHWYEKRSASDASKKAFIVNRVGDVGMFIGLNILWANFHTLTFEGVFGAMKAGHIPFDSNPWLTAAGILIFCGAVGKSAQFPLHVWLPDAMEGPTPVSALIHAATMVAAGVYLVARTFPMMTADALMVIAYVGAITAFISATIAIAQDDIKKVLAYSTVSQLGYMVMGLGVGAYTAGFFHLVTHAAFKAGLFLGAGSVIHAMHHALHHQGDHHTDPQDIRNMGGLRSKMPVTFWTFLIYTLAISGVPLTSGFMSKDEILAGTLAYGNLTGHILIPIVGFLVAGLTAFYMFRIVILAFMGKHADEHRYEHVHENPMPIILPLMILAALSTFVFYSLNPFKAATGWFFQAVERPESVVPAIVAAAGIESFEEALHHVHSTAMYLSLAVAGTGILLAFVTYYWKKISADAFAAKLAPVHRFLSNKWYFDELYNATAVAGTMGLARLLAWFDGKVVDGMVNGTARWTMGLTLGRKQNWKEGGAESLIYMGVSAVVALFAGYSAAGAMTPAGTGLGTMIGNGVLGLLIAGGVYFLLHAGVGGFDNTIVDGAVNLAAYCAGFFGLILRRVQTGRVQTYVLFVIFGIMMIFFMYRAI